MAEDTKRVMRKISRSQLRAFSMGKLKTDQAGKCLLCQETIDLTVMGNASGYVCDHDHITGEIRGVLCRGCNGAEGKVFAAVSRWAKCGKDYEKSIAWLERLIEYLKKPGYGVLYPDHKTPEERQQKTRAKANAARALAAARKRVNAQLANKDKA